MSPLQPRMTPCSMSAPLCALPVVFLLQRANYRMYFPLLTGAFDHRRSLNRNRLSFCSGFVHIDDTIAGQSTLGKKNRANPPTAHGLFRF